VDFARVEVDLIPPQACEFTEARVGESRREQKRPAAVPPAGRPSGAAAGPAQSASRRSAALNPRVPYTCHMPECPRGSHGQSRTTRPR